jgi:O-antigen/teichoic acid export membrane protein
LVIGTIVSGPLAYASLTLAARLLQPAEFGLLGALLAVSSIATIVLRPAGFGMTQLAAFVADTSKDHLRGLGGVSLVVGLATAVLLGALIAALDDALATALQASSFWPIWLLAPVLASLTCYHLTNGVLIGAQRYAGIALTGILESAVRLAATVPLVMHLGVAGSLASYMLGQAAAVALSIRLLGGLTWRAPPVSDLVHATTTGASAFMLVVSVSLLQHGDLLLLRWYGQPDEAGLYAANASIGNLFVALASPLFVPAFPRALAAHRSGHPTLPILLFTLVPVSIGGLVAATVSIWLGPLIITLLFGATFADAGAFLALYLGKITALLAAGMLGQHAIATGRSSVLRIAALAPLVGLLAMAFSKPDAALSALLACLAAIALLVTISVGMTVDRRRGRPTS